MKKLCTYVSSLNRCVFECHLKKILTYTVFSKKRRLFKLGERFGWTEIIDAVPAQVINFMSVNV